jgi:hypothetical protein
MSTTDSDTPAIRRRGFFHTGHDHHPTTTDSHEIGTLARVISAPIILVARVIAFIVALTLWVFPIAPVWLALLMRTIAAFSWATVLNLFKGTQPPDEARLNFVASFWANGFVQILASLRSRAPVTQIMPSISLWNPWEELAIACIFYLYLATTFAYLSYWLAFIAWIITGIWQIAHIIFDGIMRLYRYHTSIVV